MREIKFRAWYDNKRLLPIETIFFKDGEISVYLKDGNNIFGQGKCDVIIEQYTGLKDKNGVEIYEGDIVHGSYGIPPRGVTSVVEYNDGGFMIKTKGHNPHEIDLFTGIECLDLYIIGNIHQNPGLLK